MEGDYSTRSSGYAIVCELSFPSDLDKKKGRLSSLTSLVEPLTVLQTIKSL